jgi:hypothetical protein
VAAVDLESRRGPHLALSELTMPPSEAEYREQALFDERQAIERERDKLAAEGAKLEIEHEIQRLMVKRLGIEWPPGEPFYSVIEAEIERLRTENRELRGG